MSEFSDNLPLEVRLGCATLVTLNIMQSRFL